MSARTYPAMFPAELQREFPSASTTPVGSISGHSGRAVAYHPRTITTPRSSCQKSSRSGGTHGYPFECASPLPSLPSVDSDRVPKLHQVVSKSFAMDDADVFDEDVNAFVEDQLRFACRLALAEEQLLSVTHSFQNSMSAKKSSHEGWLDDLQLLDTVQNVKKATRDISVELGDSLCRLHDHNASSSSRAGSTTGTEHLEGDGGKSLRSHLDAFHQESSIERQTRADLQAQWVQFQKEMRREMDTHMQKLEKHVDQKLLALEQGQDALTKRVTILESSHKPTPHNETFSTQAPPVLPPAFTYAKDKLLEELRGEIRTQYDGSIGQLETALRCQEGRMREIRELMEQQVHVQPPQSERSVSSMGISFTDKLTDAFAQKGLHVKSLGSSLDTGAGKECILAGVSPRTSCATSSTATSPPSTTPKGLIRTPMPKVRASPRPSAVQVILERTNSPRTPGSKAGTKAEDQAPRLSRGVSDTPPLLLSRNTSGSPVLSPRPPPNRIGMT